MKPTEGKGVEKSFDKQPPQNLIKYLGPFIMI